MRNALKCWLIIILTFTACKNVEKNKSQDSSKKPGNSDTMDMQKTAVKSLPGSDNKARLDAKDIEGKNPGKTIEFESIALNLRDSSHKMFFFPGDRKYFHKDSLYCELLYKLKDVQLLRNETSTKGDYLSMMIDERPEADSRYYQIALYKRRESQDKMERVGTYRVDIKTRQIEKRDAVRDKWVEVK